MKKRTNSEKDRMMLGLKWFTGATASEVVEKLGGADIAELFVLIYVKVDDAEVQFLNRAYEKQLLLARTDPDRFHAGLHAFYREMAKIVKEQNLYEKFFLLCRTIYEQLERKDDMSAHILDAYHDLLMQQPPYFLGTTKRVIYGIGKDGRPLTMDEPKKDVTEINMLIHEATGIRNVWIDPMALFRKHGYPEVRTERDMLRIIKADQMLVNMMFHMTGVIREETKDIFRKPFLDPTYGIQPFQFLRPKVELPLIQARLKEREAMLPADGVTVSVLNGWDVREVYMEETEVYGEIVLLWRLKTRKSEYICGCYYPQAALCYSVWRESTGRAESHEPLEKLLLPIYLYLTCSLPAEERERLYPFSEDMADFLEKPVLRYSLRGRERGKVGEGPPRPFDRSKYLLDIIAIKPFLRSLPLGASASPEAKEEARAMGIVLPPGKTLVRGFKRKSWHIGGDGEGKG